MKNEKNTTDPFNEEYLKLQREQYSQKADNGRAFIQEALKEATQNHANNRRLLDAGCSNGFDLLKYSDMGYDVFGIDNNIETTAIARKNSVLENRIITDRMENVTNHYGKVYFDIITARFSHFLTQDIELTHQALADSLKKGGYFIAVIPNHEFFKKFFFKDNNTPDEISYTLFGKKVKVGPIPFRNVNVLSSPAFQKNFEIIRTETFNEGGIDIPNTKQSSEILDSIGIFARKK